MATSHRGILQNGKFVLSSLLSEAGGSLFSGGGGGGGSLPSRFANTCDILSLVSEVGL